MNEKFFSLPEEKQNDIINAGLRVFSENSYKKSPTSEIAAEAGISKSLLFHYFQNKKELYLYLWDKCAEVTIEHLTRAGCYEQTDLFEMMHRGMEAKLALIRKYPRLGTFVIKAYFEKDPEVRPAIQKSFQKMLDFKAMKTLKHVNPEDFIPGIDIQQMYRQMYWASEGYIWEKVQESDLNPDRMEKDFEEMLAFWKAVYLRKPDRDETLKEGEKNDDES